MKKINNFTQGYVCAVVNMINMQGCNTGEKECFQNLGMHTEKSLQKAGVEQSDIEVLKANNLLAH